MAGGTEGADMNTYRIVPVASGFSMGWIIEKREGLWPVYNWIAIVPTIEDRARVDEIVTHLQRPAVYFKADT